MDFTFAHNCVKVLDLDRSLTFYKEALGLESVRGMKPSDADIQLVFLSDGSVSVVVSTTTDGLQTEDIAKITDIVKQETGLPVSAIKILEMTGINPNTRVKDLTDEEESKLRECIDHGYIVEGDLRRQTALDIKRLTEIGCYRGLRHRRGLPVRGQRSKTNARTRKGPKRTIANKKK